jgi:hypothetical protein
MAAGYKLFAFWLARAGKAERATSGERIATITKFYRKIASITS